MIKRRSLSIHKRGMVVFDVGAIGGEYSHFIYGITGTTNKDKALYKIQLISSVDCGLCIVASI